MKLCSKGLHRYSVRRRASGTYPGCPACKAIYASAYYAANPTRQAGRKTPLTIKRRATNRRTQQVWRRANPQKIRAKNAKRRAAELQRCPPWLSEIHLKEIEQFYKDAVYLSTYTKVPFQVDHVIPLRGEHISGLHVPWNLQLLTKSENSAKKNRIIR